MGNVMHREGCTKNQLATIRIEKLESQEAKYLDKIHQLNEQNRLLETQNRELHWKLKNGISRQGYENLLRVKNKREATVEQMCKFDKADVNGDDFLTFTELEHACS